MQSSPLTAWMNLWAAGWNMAQTGMKLAELASASQEVVESRTKTIKSAIRNPLKGNYRELGRMLPEKLTAFSQAAEAAAQDVSAMQMDAIATYQQMVDLASGRRPMMPLDWLTLASRSTRMMERAMLAGGRTLAPIHLAATKNAKRLRRKGGSV